MYEYYIRSKQIKNILQYIKLSFTSENIIKVVTDIYEGEYAVQLEYNGMPVEYYVYEQRTKYTVKNLIPRIIMIIVGQALFIESLDLSSVDYADTFRVSTIDAITPAVLSYLSLCDHNFYHRIH